MPAQQKATRKGIGGFMAEVKMLLGNGLVAGAYSTVREKYECELKFFETIGFEKDMPVWFHNPNEVVDFSNEKKATHLVWILWKIAQEDCYKELLNYRRGKLTRENLYENIRETYRELLHEYQRRTLTEGYELIARTLVWDPEFLLKTVEKWHKEELEKVKAAPTIVGVGC